MPLNISKWQAELVISYALCYSKFMQLPCNPCFYNCSFLGRRGKDPLGTVIILCKAGVPDFQELKNMLIGSAAKLQSQFRLTYSMILNLLRVENLSVEDVMKRSFLEAGKSKNLEKYKENKNKVIEKLELLENQPRDGHLLELSMKIKDYLQMRKSIMVILQIICLLKLSLILRHFL